MVKPNREWFITVPWGKIAMISWGDPQGEPMLLIHGRQDSAATFLPLLELMPKTYHYVAIDLPGHGKSDPFPSGLLLMRFTYVVVIDYVLKELKWDNFVYLAHSLGTEIGLFYNAVYPKRVSKFILLDPVPAFSKTQIESYQKYIDFYHREYYDNYALYNDTSRVISKRKALDAVMAARGLTEPEAEVILSRNLTEVGHDRYKLSWDRRLKIIAPIRLTNEFYLELFSKNARPTLVITAKGLMNSDDEKMIKSYKLFDDFSKYLVNFKTVFVEGNHDVHFTHPETFISQVRDFLQENFSSSKL